LNRGERVDPELGLHDIQQIMLEAVPSLPRALPA
jgi:hypothetical protein